MSYYPPPSGPPSGSAYGPPPGAVFGPPQGSPSGAGGGFGPPQGPPSGPPGYGGPSPSQGYGDFKVQPNSGGTVITDTVGFYEGVNYRIDHRDSNSVLSLSLQPGYEVKAKPGAMVAMAATVAIKGKLKFSMKKLLTGADLAESYFTGPGEVLLAPEIWGDVIPIRLDGNTHWSLGKHAFLAATRDVVRAVKSQGFVKGFLSGEGMFVAQISGVGMLWIQALGAIVQKQLAPGEQWLVDHGHLVAWNCDYKVERIGGGGFMSNQSTGEGSVCRFIGPGLIYIQTRNPQALADWIAEQMPNRG